MLPEPSESSLRRPSVARQIRIRPGNSRTSATACGKEEFEIAIGGWATAEDKEVDLQAEEGIEEGQQHGRAE
jgi:hypothetical protein